ncbi:hypothetical protein EHI47_06005 [Rhizobium leguminosarum]|uniref:Uncharacterized protein n=2 Tax=Rhizobium TaxID=379 RepID=A0A444I817_RHILE|nr:hypothetical protein [Rhizobium leguminosarum bv. viciae]RWX34899.1 hypothetical protein EHI47_06005 [Rhizobium leguminosarum]TAU53206.1 hypothetical protein ELI43_10545 [Rhizobium leguminosarum]TBC73222.1 hypothetical protein ELH27_10365 [Rhizobium leguminosarum]TBE71099.1 hypothetical protein ELH03_10245 [Rhizobium beringeri]
MRQFGIIEPSGNDKAWWTADWHLLEVMTTMRSSFSLGIRDGTQRRRKGRRYPSSASIIPTRVA